jgi:hypothetical protein
MRAIKCGFCLVTAQERAKLDKFERGELETVEI